MPASKGVDRFSRALERTLESESQMVRVYRIRKTAVPIRAARLETKTIIRSKVDFKHREQLI